MLLLLTISRAFLIEENLKEIMNEVPSEPEPEPIDFEAYSRIYPFEKNPFDSLFDSSTLRQFKRAWPVGGFLDFNKVKRSLQFSDPNVFGEKVLFLKIYKDIKKIIFERDSPRKPKQIKNNKVALIISLRLYLHTKIKLKYL